MESLKKISIPFFILSILFSSCGPNLPDNIKEASQYIPEEIDFNLHVKPILSDRCFACHGPDKNNQKGGLRLDIEESAKSELTENPGHFAIKSSNLGKSELVHRILMSDSEEAMPPPESNLTLSDYEKAILIKWIEDGAEYKPHWSFIKPVQQPLPKINQTDWPKNEVDYFVLKKLEEKNWQPSTETDKEILLRRVSFDLTGLPPTLEEMNSFLKDDSPEAYEKVIDRLLASPQYGERMATDWMDLSRFADTHGYTVDRYRDMSPWRDWVIKAFNENMPYDEFVTWQMAGDMLPNATREQKLATGFNRNHQQNMEGGIVDEEFRVEYVADRTNTLGAAFLGITLECARCHDHKYDPISQKDYYQLFSYFNNVNEAGQISYDNALPVPTMLLTDKETEEAIAFIESKIEKTEDEIESINQESEKTFEDWAKNKRTQLSQKSIYKSAIAHFDLNKTPLINRINPRNKGIMKQQHIRTKIEPNLVDGKNDKGIALDGDAWLDLDGAGAFERDDPFSVAIWVNIPENLENGVIFHKGDGAALFNFKGYHIALRDNGLEALLAHTTPNNAITKYAESIPRDQWIHLTMTYDGSSKAAGLNIFLNGKPLEMETEVDNLYKSILFQKDKEPGLQIGARWRGKGVRGAIADDIIIFDKELTPPEIVGLYDVEELDRLTTTPFNQLSQNEKNGFKAYYLANHSIAQLKQQNSLIAMRKEKNAIVDTVREIMVMEERSNPRQAYILERGQYNSYGEPVKSETPASILPWPEDLPRNRLGLAKWLVHQDNPLTARVTVNRIWQSVFGRGLVKTVEDFGSQGELPSHPDLLDWIAVEFQENNWDLKSIMKLMVMSATYRQSSIANEQLTINDPENVWLGRGPANRLTAEMLRDNALAASGLLSKKIGGKSVKPYQPKGLWRMNSGAYKQDEGESLYRRGLYTFWKRTVPYPGQSTFDAPSRSICSVKRQKTNTPLQALIMLNDPVYLETARIMGQEIAEAKNPEIGIENVFRKLTGRKPSKDEKQLLLTLQKEEYQRLSAEPERIKGWTNVGEMPNNQSIDKVKLAANAIVASTIINADATLMKR